MTVFGEVVLLMGAVLTMIAGIGVVRFHDVFTRLHALTKASTLGLLLVLAGAGVILSHPNDVTSIVLAGVLQLLTLPVSSNLLARAAYRVRLNRD